MQGASDSPPADEMRVVVLPTTAADGVAIRRLLDSSNLSCLVAPSIDAACEAVRRGAGALVIAEELLDTHDSRLAECIRAQPVWSDLPVVLLSSSGSSESATLPELVPQLGNVSVVERPVRMSTLVSLIRSSLRARGRQYQVREHLAQQEDAQRAIREAQQRFRLLVENIDDYAIFMIDTEGRVASWNSGAEHALGYSSDEILGQPASRFFVPEGPGDDVLGREMKEAQATGRATTTGWRARKSGEHFYVEGVLNAVRDDEGRLLGYAKLMKDVTDKRRIEAEREQLLQSERAARSEAERTSRMKDEFLATLGHELRTPLNAILGWSQVLRRIGGGNAQLGEGLKVIERNARAQAQIIEDLLDMSSIISGKVRLEMRGVDAASILEAAVNAVRPAAEAKGIELTLVLDPTGAVRADPNRLQQVFWNLLTNAVKFTPKGGRVAVALERVNSHLKVSVADDGEGIDPAFLPYVFERFRQADASASRRHGGLGLGLSIAKQLVELHGGSIHASSDGHGTGSTFTVELPAMVLDIDAAGRGGPRQQPSHSIDEPLDAYAPAAKLGGVRVLVVDDEPDARSLIERLLENCEATVTTAGSAREALEQVAREAPDVLLSDIGMPTEDGYSLMRRIRRLSGEAGRIPAIALTAYARAEDRVKALQAGYQMHLAKPVEPVKLIEMIASLVKPRAGGRGGSPSASRG
jgi:PAS domain S-box-containing protein